MDYVGTRAHSDGVQAARRGSWQSPTGWWLSVPQPKRGERGRGYGKPRHNVPSHDRYRSSAVYAAKRMLPIPFRLIEMACSVG
jgi:hypothetical protein